MAFYSSEEIYKARQLDLFSYLQNYNPDELVKINRNNYCTREHDSLKISNGLWYWFSRGIGGKSALDYLMIVKDYSFVDAVGIILGYMNESPPIKYESKVKEKSLRNIKLILPERNDNNNQVINYLVSRGIDKDIILECIDNDLIYEQADNHNVVFVGYDKNNTPRYAGIRATNPTRFMKDAYGSHKGFSFRLESIENNSNSVHLFESAIDLLSYATLLKMNNIEWYNENLLSLSGVYQPSKNIGDSKIPLALNYFLNQHPEINKVVLHLDNDRAGITATNSLKKVLPKKYIVIDNPPPFGKDVNDFLCNKLGINNKKKQIKER